jgi:hypothetical protein
MLDVRHQYSQREPPRLARFRDKILCHFTHGWHINDAVSQRDVAVHGCASEFRDFEVDAESERSPDEAKRNPGLR